MCCWSLARSTTDSHWAFGGKRKDCQSLNSSRWRRKNSEYHLPFSVFGGQSDCCAHKLHTMQETCVLGGQSGPVAAIHKNLSVSCFLNVVGDCRDTNILHKTYPTSPITVAAVMERQGRTGAPHRQNSPSAERRGDGWRAHSTPSPTPSASAAGSCSSRRCNVWGSQRFWWRIKEKAHVC